MATTTNYGWTTPDDTALVKDGASAIRTLGSSVDTTTKALNPSTTLGDIEYRSSTANTNTRLGIGTTGQVLSVSGGVPAWSTVSSGGMTLLSTTTLSGASTTISSIDQTYKNLQIVIRNFDGNTDPGYCAIQMNGDSTASRHENRSTFGASNNISFGNEQWEVFYPVDDVTTQNLAVINIFDYANTTTWKMGTIFSLGNNDTTTTNFNARMTYGVYNQTSAISSLKFLPVIGNFTSGTVLVYGVK